LVSLRDIRLQKLFLFTVVLKTGFSWLAWELRMPWSLGFWAPLTTMAVYVALGLRRRDRDVSDEKFADSCYYLGFIFTITSIVFSLFDLPSIGTHLQDIAVRFGAAMVSTVAGLVVRVYLVSFRADALDALDDAERSVVDASRRFREGLALAVEKLADYEIEVDRAARSTVERVTLQVERLSMDHANRLDALFSDLERRHQAGVAVSIDEVAAAHARLSDAFAAYGHGLDEHLATFKDRIDGFATAMDARLQTTTFPDDYFARQLAGPLNLMRDAAKDLSTQVLRVSNEVVESQGAITASMRRLRAKAGATDEALDSVSRLTAQQQAVLDAAREQLAALEVLGGTLMAIEASLLGESAGEAARERALQAQAQRVARARTLAAAGVDAGAGAGVEASAEAPASTGAGAGGPAPAHADTHLASGTAPDSDEAGLDEPPGRRP
jgi:hypothetical protein